MPDTPTFDEALRQALAGLDNDDVRVFYAYFDELKRKARAALHQQAGTHADESAVAHSALRSLFADVTVARVSLTDVDEIAVRIGRSEATVSNRLTRIRDLLESA